MHLIVAMNLVWPIEVIALCISILALQFPIVCRFCFLKSFSGRRLLLTSVSSLLTLFLFSLYESSSLFWLIFLCYVFRYFFNDYSNVYLLEVLFGGQVHPDTVVSISLMRVFIIFFPLSILATSVHMSFSLSIMDTIVLF